MAKEVPDDDKPSNRESRESLALAVELFGETAGRVVDGTLPLPEHVSAEQQQIAREIMLLVTFAVTGTELAIDLGARGLGAEPREVLPRLADALAVLRGRGEQRTERLAAYVSALQEARQHLEADADPWVAKMWRYSLAKYHDPAFANLTPEKLRHELAAEGASGIYRAAADLAISVGAFDLAREADAAKLANALRSYVSRHSGVPSSTGK